MWKSHDRQVSSERYLRKQARGKPGVTRQKSNTGRRLFHTTQARDIQGPEFRQLEWGRESGNRWKACLHVKSTTLLAESMRMREKVLIPAVSGLSSWVDGREQNGLQVQEWRQRPGFWTQGLKCLWSFWVEVLPGMWLLKLGTLQRVLDVSHQLNGGRWTGGEPWAS